MGTRVALVAMVACTRSFVPPTHVEERYEGPIASRDTAEGGRIYLTLCTACHNGRVNPRGYHWSPGQMRRQIREGNLMMPPLDERFLSDAQVEAVLAYLLVMNAIDGELPPIPPEPAPPPRPLVRPGEAVATVEVAPEVEAEVEVEVEVESVEAGAVEVAPEAEVTAETASAELAPTVEPEVATPGPEGEAETGDAETGDAEVEEEEAREGETGEGLARP